MLNLSDRRIWLRLGFLGRRSARRKTERARALAGNLPCYSHPHSNSAGTSTAPRNSVRLHGQPPRFKVKVHLRNLDCHGTVTHRCEDDFPPGAGFAWRREGYAVVHLEGGKVFLPPCTYGPLDIPWTCGL